MKGINLLTPGIILCPCGLTVFPFPFLFVKPQKRTGLCPGGTLSFLSSNPVLVSLSFVGFEEKDERFPGDMSRIGEERTGQP